MSGAKKNDPFNFDDIYRQAGVEDLFVKKTMGELKQRSPGPPGPPAVSQPSRPMPSGQAPAKPAASTFDLDFLSSIASASKGGTPNSLSKPSSAANLAAVGSQPDLSQKQRQQQPLGAAIEDPFALFQEVPGAAPVQRHAPPPAPAQPLSGGGLLLDFDDGDAFPASATRPAGVPSPPVVAAASASGVNAALEQRPSAQASVAPAARPAQYPTAALPQSPAPAATQQPPQPPPPAYDEHAAHHAAPPGANYQPPRQFRGRSSSGGGSSGVPDGYRDPAHQGPQQRPSPYDEYSHGPASSASASPPIWAGPSAPVPPESTGAGAGGISSYLKAFGKKAVRAAKAGLAQLEHALEGLDAAAAQQQQQQQHAGAAPHGTRWSGNGSGRSYEGDAVVGNDEALAWAVRLGDLAPHAQQQELAQMPPALRRKVIEVLREQVRVEHEAARGGAAGPGPGPRVGPGTGHGAALDATAPGPFGAPAYGHGAPVRPPAAGAAPAPHDAVPGHHVHGVRQPHAHQQLQQSPSGAGGVAAAAVAAQPRQPAEPAPAPPQPPRQPQAREDHHDLLGIGSAEAARPPGAASAPAPAPVPPAVDDLLGFGSDRTAPARAAPAAPSSPAPPRSPAPAAPAAVPPAAVHVEDMDDFFSGGRGSAGASGAATPYAAAAVAAGGGGASRAASGAMHASSSAPSLGARAAGGATACSSSAATVTDFLHDDGDDLGGLGALGAGGADVDVSGYADLYRGEQGDANEPEIRKRLRAQREAAKHAKMKAALAEKLAMEAEEATRREQQVVLKETYKTNIEAWKNKNKGNIRGLLGSLHTVLWPDSGWAPVSVADLLEPAQIKKVYMRANLLVHPDKVRQRNGSAEQVAIADMVFDVLKEAWNAFR